MRRWSVRSVLFQGCLDRGGGGLAQAEEDPSDAVLVTDGIAVEHGVDGDYDVVAELVRRPGGRLDPDARRDAADHDLGNAATAELIVQVGACECAPPVLRDEDVLRIGAELWRERSSTASTRSWPPVRRRTRATART